MICISVTPKSRTLAKVDLLNASRQGDIIELCIDYLVKTPDFNDLIGGLNKPVIISCRRKQDGGHWAGTEEERISLLRQAIVAGPDYIELDLDIAAEIPRYGKTQRVIAITRLDHPEYDIDSILEEAAKHQADVIKFRWPTLTLSDAWPLLAVVCQHRSIPIVGQGLSRGELTFSVLGMKYNSPWIYAALEKGMEDFPGQATIRELKETYHIDDINKKTTFIAVAGLTEAETQTLKMMNEGFRKLSLNIRCLPVHIKKTDRLTKMFDILKIKVLIANKHLASRLLPLADHASGRDRATDYFDLFLKQADGWHGYNSLLRSLRKNLDEVMHFTSGSGKKQNRSAAMIIGTNSTAKTVIQLMQKEPMVINVTGTDEKQARKLAEELQIRHVPFQGIYESHCDLVILTDSEVKQGTGRQQINPSYFQPGMTVVDLCNIPLEHELTVEARQRGCQILEATEIWKKLTKSQFKTITGEALPL
ncbi:MAG: type I 3-dehydroquinate dehydratase [Planctomycetaceae bacterium]|nr:type I 3-dehydroquinate dehydratase [Planctomycetaceae bacterium]